MSTEAEAIADLALKGAAADVVAYDGRSFLVVRNDQHTVELTDPQNKPDPKRVIQGVTLQTVDSLVDYANRFGGADTVLFADIAANSMTALIDYHSEAANGIVAPAHVGHRATMVLPFAEEWKAWSGISGRMLEQIEFARFLEENASDVSAPSGADLLETIRDIQAHRKVDFRKAVRTSSDNENFEYEDNTTATTKKGSVEIPTKFQLRIPVYFGEPEVEVYAFLRWRLEDANLKLGIVLHRAEHVRQAVFKQVVLDAAERTSRPAMFGKAA